MDKTPKFDYSDIHFQDNGKLKLLIIVGLVEVPQGQSFLILIHFSVSFRL